MEGGDEYIFFSVYIFSKSRNYSSSIMPVKEDMLSYVLYSPGLRE